MTQPSPSTLRFSRERRELLANPIDGVLITWPANSLDKLTAEITAPEDSLYHDDTFTLTIEKTSTYPRYPPRVVMQTPIFHPNIDSHGAVCVACLRLQWNATVTIRNIIEEVIDALRHPNPFDELSVEAATMMKNDPAQFESVVREQVSKNILQRGG